MLKKALLFAILIQSCSHVGLSDTVTLQPVADTSLFETNPDSNLGAADLASGTTAKGLKSRALIRFDLVGQIPANATIASATLTLRVTKAPFSAAASTFGLHRVAQDWGEGAKTGIIGDPATAGEATWKARLFPTTLWSAPGAAAPGDYAAKASASKFVAGAGDYTFASTPDLVADVQAWLANPQSNFGWILISQSEGTPRTARRFGSSEDPATAPSLIIEFTAPAQATPPSIAAQPQNQSATVGGTVTFSVTASGTAPLSYQWRFNGTDLPGATSPALTLSNVQAANAGSYTVVVSNAGGSVTSAAAVLAVASPTTAPAITQQPQSQSAAAGANVTFSVTATGTAPLSYQWKFNNTDLVGQTNPTLTLNNVQTANAGSYSVVVNNAAGSATSLAATLSVDRPTPSLSVSDASVIEGNAGSITAVFTVSLSAPSSQMVTADFATSDGTATSGSDYVSTSGTLTLLPGTTKGTIAVQIIGDDVVEPDESFLVRLSNPVNASISRAQASGTILNDDFPLAITAQPKSQTVTVGGTASFTTTAAGSGTLRYQWKFNGVDITGATNSTLVLSNVQPSNDGNYTVVVTDASGSVTSSVATLTVPGPATPPTITLQPQPQTVDAGANVTFTVVATGDAPLRYQWKFNDVDVPGATGPVLSLSSVQASNAGSYSATVSNSAGSATSAAALLSVRSLPPPSRNRWTIMIYGHADHNLSGSLVVDMQEMEAAGSGPDFNVVLQADFDASSPRNAAAGLPADLSKGVTRFLIQKDNDPNTITSTVVERLPELNMDDPKVLTQFITWAAQKYPADRYGLILWNHGGQWQGFGGDSQDGTLQDRGILSTAQIRQAVTSAMPATGIAKWEFVSFDTCLMGGAEVLTDFVPLTDVFIACPEIDYGDGWDYEAAFNFLKANPAVSALDFGRAEVKAWEAQHMQPGKDSDLELAAHALYDLTKYAAFEEKFNAFASLLAQSATPQNLALPRLRLDTTQYSLSGVKDIGKPTDYLDLGELADRLIADPTTDAALKAAASSLVASIDTMVVAKVRGTKKQLAHALSAYYPVDGAKDNQAYLSLTISSKPGSAWSQFLTKVSENKTGDNTAPDIAQADVTPAGFTPLGSAPSNFSASIAQPASVRVKVVNGADAYAIFASIVDNHFTTKTNEYVYLGEVLYAPVKGVGTYNVPWNGALPMLSNTAGTNSVVLGGFFDDVGSDILVSFAEYAPPGSADTQVVALLTQMKGNKGEVINVLDAEVEELAPEGIDVEPGGKLTPLYYLERRKGDDPDAWESDDVRGKASIVIPANGLDGLVVNVAQLPTGIYTMEVQVEDAYENESDVLEYLISVGQPQAAPKITVQTVAANQIKISWPASAGDYALEANTALSTSGWAAVPTGQVVTEGTNKAFTETISGPTRFYRLKKN